MKVAIVGCGVAGMASAIALSRQGAEVTLFERFSTPRPLGAGLLLQPTGLAALERLGLRAAVEAKGAQIARLHGRTPKGRTVLDLRYARWRPDAYGLGIHRGALFGALFSALERTGARIEAGCEIAAVAVAGRTATLEERDGRRFGPFDLAIVADGAHSVVRGRLFPEARAPINRWAALWTVLPDHAGRCSDTLEQVYAGSARMAGVLPIGGGEVALFWSLRGDRLEAWRAGGLEAWRAAVGAVWPEAAELLAALEDPADVAFATYRDVRASPWRSGAAILIGDAAHGTSPQLGQGANLALVDALALADGLRGMSDLESALDAFERARRPWTGWTQLLSRGLTPVFQSEIPGLGLARDLAMPVALRIPPIEQLMLSTLAGAARLPGLPRPPADRLPG